MPGLLRRKVLKKEHADVFADKYIDLGEIEIDAEIETQNRVKIAEIYSYDDVVRLLDQVYEGNILILDYTPIINDELALRRIVEELKSVVRDTGGDVAGIGRNMLMVTPTGIKIDRKKIKGAAFT
ncbi:MAG: hypothetical protein DRN20_00430 [Thermoplasmata archaeon]|nr:MAG: hypothetical protein DRN20_00430 [Thermoplasmata archaeon]